MPYLRQVSRMREELRRKIPKTSGWYTGSILGILAVIGLVIWLVWRSAQAESPQRAVQAALEAARAKNVAGVGALLTPDSMSDPAAPHWLEQFAIVLGRPGVAITDVALLRDEANVSVAVPHPGVSGGTTTATIVVKTVRVHNQWRIDLPTSMASANLQFWQALAGETS
jgi:hypothetical protein